MISPVRKQRQHRVASGRRSAGRSLLPGIALPCLLTLLGGCQSLPQDFTAPAPSSAPQPTTSGPLADFSRASLAGLPADNSAFRLIYRNDDDLRWRLALIDSAVESLDLQTYLWRNDFGGGLLLDRIHRAAERGVRVRLLADDFVLRGLDRGIATLDAHPNIEVRIWNPGRQRRLGRNLSYMASFRELNFRLHNKVLIADNRAAITGGRNLANEYFGVSERFNFFDVDVLAVGPVVPPMSDMFDLYWNSWQATPGALFHPRASVDDIPDMTERRRLRLQRSELREIFPLPVQDWTDWLAAAAADMHRGIATVLYDKPGDGAPSMHAREGLRDFFRQAEKEVQVTSPYLVPGEIFFTEARALEERGVKVAVMTNSLGSTNQSIVHAAYARARVPMLEAGVDLFEMRYEGSMQAELDTAPVESRWAALHAKCAVVDRKRVHIGSYNVTPRSANLNTELGLLIDSEALARQLGALLDRATAPENAWQLKLDANRRLRWLSSDGQLNRQPSRSFWRTIQSGFFGLFPLKELL